VAFTYTRAAKLVYWNTRQLWQIFNVLSALLVQINGTDQRKADEGSQQFIQHGQPITTYKFSEITKKDRIIDIIDIIDIDWCNIY
jgi:hypothetical protein